MKRIVILIVIILGLASHAFAACPSTHCYVSNTTANGYVVGNDSNTGASKSLPFLTYGKAVNVAIAGDTIHLNDGDYLTTDGSYGATYITLTKAITVLPETALGVRITSTSSSQNHYINPTATGVYTFGAIMLNTAGGYTGVGLNATAYNPSVIFNGTDIYGYTLRAFGTSEDAPRDIEFRDVTMTSSASARSDCNVISVTGIAAGNVLIDGLIASNALTGSGGNVDGIKITGSTGSAATLKMYDVNVTISSTTSSASQINPNGIIYVKDILDWKLDGFNLATTGNVTGTYGVHISTGCTNAAAGNGTVSVTWTGGYGAVSYSNNTEFYRIIALNANTDQGQTPHGIAQSTNTGGVIRNCIASGWSPAFYGEGTDSTTIIHSNIGYKNYGSYGIYFKGVTGTKGYNNTMVSSPGYNSVCLSQQINGSTNSTNADWQNNLCYNTSTNPVFVHGWDANQTGTFQNNLYYATEALISTSWQYGGSNYGTYATWVSGKEASALWGNPLFVDEANNDYRLLWSSSGKSAAIGKGKPIAALQGKTCRYNCKYSQGLPPMWNIGASQCVVDRRLSGTY